MSMLGFKSRDLYILCIANHLCYSLYGSFGKIVLEMKNNLEINIKRGPAVGGCFRTVARFVKIQWKKHVLDEDAGAL